MAASTTAPEKPKEKSKAWTKAREDRAALILSLHDWDEEAYAAKLESCQNTVLIRCLDCDGHIKTEQGCKRRWCPVCARAITAERCAKFRIAVERMSNPIFVTLTMQNVADARQGIGQIRAAFGRWKRQKWFKSLNVAGGIASLEITNRGNGWHPHLHILLDCDWLAPSRLKPQLGDSPSLRKAKTVQSQAELSAAWATALKTESAIVWVKKAGPEIVTEVLKYSVKPSDLIHCADNPGDVIRAMERTRLVTTWGSCYGLSKELREEAKETREPCKCEKCGGSNWMPEAVWSRCFDRLDTTRRTYYDPAPQHFERIK